MMHSSIQQWSNHRFRLLVVLIVIVGASQGLVSPLIATMLELQRISPSINGISAAMLYLGMLVSLLFCAKLVYRFGYQKTIVIGLIMIIVTMILFPFTDNIIWWSVLRFLLGVGDNITCFAVQLWIASTVSPKENGKRFAQFGLAYGLGMGLGPLGLNLTQFGFAVPFSVIILFLVIFLTISLIRLENGIPQSPAEVHQDPINNSYSSVYMIGFLALWPALLYGFLEVAFAGVFPIYGLRIGLTKVEVSFLITSFIWGSLLFQIPLGIWGDRIGRYKLLCIICTVGGLGIMLVPAVGKNVMALVLLLGFTGGLVGSLYSLSLAYLGDILPTSMITKGNALANTHLSIGSIIGPYIGGTLMQYAGLGSLFYFLGISLLSFVVLSIFLHQKSTENIAFEKTHAG